MRDSSRIELVAVGASESGSVPSLCFRPSLKKDRVPTMVAVVPDAVELCGESGKGELKFGKAFDVLCDKMLNTGSTCWRGGVQTDALIVGWYIIRPTVKAAEGGYKYSTGALARHGSGVGAQGAD